MSFKDISSSLLFSYAIGAPPPPLHPLQLIVLIHQVGWLYPCLTSWPKIETNLGVKLEKMEPQGEQFWAAQAHSSADPTSRICRCDEVGPTRSFLKHKLLLDGFSILHGCFSHVANSCVFCCENTSNMLEVYECLLKMLLQQCYVFRKCLILLEDLAMSDGYLLRPVLISCIPILFFAPLIFLRN
jgi:hypothetical protein